MKTAKRLWALLLAAMMIVMIPTSAFAGGSKYVPVAGYCEYSSDGGATWTKSYDFSMKYKKNGNISSYTRIDADDGSVSTTSYKWKKDKVVRKFTSYSDGYSETYTCSFKKNLLKSEVYSEVYGSTTNTTTTTYAWKKKTATVTSQYNNNTPSTYTVKVNKKGRIVMENYPASSEDPAQTVSYKYYGNGNLKSCTYTYGTSVSYTRYNKSGYITSDDEVAYTYTKNKKKKAPASVQWSYNNGRTIYRKTYTAYKKVSAVKNCDATGYSVRLG